MKCGEPCNRPPCELNCPKLLTCSHSCVGFCGEPCPPLCRICDHDTLLGGVFSGEDKISDSDRFVYLVNCGHTIEHESLARWMRVEENNGEINPKSCPLCRQKIWTCRRFNKIVLKSRNDIMEVKTKIYGEPIENLRKVRAVRENLEEHERTATSNYLPTCFKDFLTYLLDRVQGEHLTESYQREHGLRWLPRMWVEGMESLANIYLDGVATLRGIEKAELTEILIKYYERLFHCVNEDQRFPMMTGERADVFREHRRIRDLKIFFDLHPSKLPTTLKNLFGKPEVQVLHKEAFDSLTKDGPYTLDLHYHVKQVLEDLSGSLTTTIDLTEEERIEILGAFGTRSGRWFKCKNGHPYVITECGGAMVTGICPDCKAEIGGANHQLLEDNELATDMDGAIEPLYPIGLLDQLPPDEDMDAQN